MNQNPDRGTVEALIRILAVAEGLPPDVIVRQCEAESSFRQYEDGGGILTSKCGAMGLFQIVPATARELGIDPGRWHENVFGGLRYMGRLHRSFGGIRKALAAYNWGPGNLNRAILQAEDQWEAKLPAETSKYLKRILEDP